MNRDDYRHLLLAGTVTFPATFPQLGSITLIPEATPSGIEGGKQHEMLVVKEFPSAKVTISRKVMVDNVRAVFIPQDPSRVSYDWGTWLLVDEIAEFLRGKERVRGIVFVLEAGSTLLEVLAGMTAGESAQYYPPLPQDRSFNHYGSSPRPAAMMSCNVSDNADFASIIAPTPDREMMDVENIGLESFFSCNAEDDIPSAMLSCDSSDMPSEF